MKRVLLTIIFSLALIAVFSNKEVHGQINFGPTPSPRPTSKPNPTPSPRRTPSPYFRVRSWWM